MDVPYELRRLDENDEAALTRFLLRSPSENAFFLGQLARGALGDETVAGTIVGCETVRARELVGAACFGSNLILAHALPEGSFSDLARVADEAGWLVRVVVGPDALVGRFVAAFSPYANRVALERGGQILFELQRGALPIDARSAELRPAQLHELDQLIAADLAMVREELGFDPFSSDAEGFRRGWHRRIQEWRAWVVGPLGGPIRFKVDQASASADVVQLAGVWTRPVERGEGLAKRALGEMCHLLLREVPRICLYVNQENVAALRLYRKLGFREVGRVRSVWFETS